MEVATGKNSCKEFVKTYEPVLMKQTRAAGNTAIPKPA